MHQLYAMTVLLLSTVEDPSESFQRVRDFIDARNCLKLTSFQPESLHLGFTDAMQSEARDKLKLNRVTYILQWSLLSLNSHRRHSLLYYRSNSMVQNSVEVGLKHPFR
jgi:hypothetical protein